VSDQPIRVLDPTVANQIAAGEVVERPAAVVKELLENSLDAGATRVTVDFSRGGKALMVVEDDGKGMSPDEALLSLERHATSKLRLAADLDRIATFGFRGEALPSIASVARFTLQTRPAAAPSGVEILVNGGKVIHRRDHGMAPGTRIEVANLFHPVPARLKFLKSDETEAAHIIRLVRLYAVAHPSVGFLLREDGRELFRSPGKAPLLERVREIWGRQVAAELAVMPPAERPGLRLSGLLGRPGVSRATRQDLVTVVNGRPVDSRAMVFALTESYHTVIPKGRYPLAFLFLEMDPAWVDVNVHPAKAEVRFVDRWTVERAVERAVRRALGTEDSAALVGHVRPSPFAERALGSPLGIDALRQPAPAAPVPLFDDAETAAPGGPPVVAPSRTGDPDDEIVVPVLTQFHRTYLAFERGEALVLIDQHSAHERVLYERFMRIFESGESPAQRLLFPLTLHLTPAEAEAFEANREPLARLGFEAEGFGGTSVVVHAVPNPHPRFDAARCLRESLAALSGDREASAIARHERLAATVACKAAVKAGDLLAPEEMRALYVALARTTLPAHDVHGRATILQLGWDEIDRRFGRT